MICPECGSDHVDRDEVDIGVGVQCGPWGCFDCGWTEGQARSRDRCILNCDSPSYPPDEDEKRQCGCRMCVPDTV